ncbi:MAG: ABC transporter ATP-binding protein [bacterium]|nr:ABC transporter ATP-binding protein [bacterium]
MLRVRKAGKMFTVKNQPKWILKDISMDINHGEMFGLIGESGCGKTTLGKIILRLFPTIEGGTVKFDSRNIFEYSTKEMYGYRRDVQMIFQNPDATLNPSMTIGKSIIESIRLGTGNNHLSRQELRERAKKYLNAVRLQSHKLDDYPYQLSGGEKRRIGLIRALAVKPKLIVADEPFSGLDISTKRQLANLFLNRYKEEKAAFLFISHEIDAVRYLCQQVSVMYRGRIIETGQKSRVVYPSHAKHPYTQGMLDAMDCLCSHERRQCLGWEISTSVAKEGCVFKDRCYIYRDKLGKNRKTVCDQEQPLLKMIDDNQSVACHYWDY